MKNLTRLINKFKSSKMIQNVAKISSGTMLGQLISIITLPIYARLFGAKIMGDWALVTSVAIIVNTFSDFGLSNAIMIEEDEKNTVRLFSVITTMVFSVSLLVGLGYLFFYQLFPNELDMNVYFYAFFVFIQIFTSQQIQLCYTFLNRQKQYNILMRNPIINNISAAIITIPLGILGFTRYGYYTGLIIGQAITLIHMRRAIPKVFFDFKISDYKELIKRHKDFCFFQMPANIASQLRNQIPTLFIKFLYGSEILGYYSVSVKVLKIPITFLASAIGKVYFQTVSEMKRKGQEIGEFTFINMYRAMKIAIFPMIIIIATSDIVCSFFLGDKFIIAGQIARIVAFNTFFNFLINATQGIVIVLHKQKYTFNAAIVQIAGYIGGLFVGKYFFNSIYIGCLIMTTFFCVSQIIIFSLIFNNIGITAKRYIKSVFSCIGIITVGAIILRALLIVLGVVSGV